VVLSFVLIPVANDRAGLVNVVEGIPVQAPITHTTVKGFSAPVASGLTWWNVVNAKLANNEFVASLGNELGPVIAPQRQVCSALGNDFHYVVGNLLAND
jgi:hypothetical protein